MPERIYFDTNAFRAVGTALENASLSDDLKAKVVVSPLTVFEVLSQLTVANAEDILRQVHAIHNWTDPENTALLPWPDDALAEFWLGKMSADNGFTGKMQKAFNICLAAESVEPLREDAGKLRDAIDVMNRRTAKDFGRLVNQAREQPFRFSEAWFLGIANRIHADPTSKSIAEIVELLSAYHEFEKAKLQTALQYPEYNPENHMNDLLDAEQLIYLASPTLCFLTCDKGFERVKKSEQATRIAIVSPADLSDFQKIETLLRKLV